MVSSEKNFQCYRDSIQTTKGTAILPYSAMYLKDITFIEDGNHDFVDVNKVNISKVTMMASYLVHLLHFQKNKFQFKKDLSLRSQLMHNVVILTEEEQYELSKRCQGILDAFRI